MAGEWKPKKDIPLINIPLPFPADAHQPIESGNPETPSLGANIAEAWAKRKYAAHFVSKSTDVEGEWPGKSRWLAAAFDCNQVKSSAHDDLQATL